MGGQSRLSSFDQCRMRSRLAVGAIAAVATCALALGLHPAFAFADAPEAPDAIAEDAITLEEGETAEVPEAELPYDAIAAEADQAADAQDMGYDTKTTTIDGIVYKYYIGDEHSQVGAGAYVVNTSSAAAVVLPQKIEGQDVYVRTDGTEGAKNEVGPFVLDASKAVALKYLQVNNPLTSIDVSANSSLVYLGVNGYYDGDANGLSVLDVTKCAALLSLDCAGNQLDSLDLSGNPELQSLNCAGNRLSSLDLSKNSKLVSLSCGGNRLASLDVSKNAKLQMLQCQNNRLSALDVSSNEMLGHLYCPNNYLTKLDVSKNPELVYLVCSNNDLRELNVSKNTKLTSLYCAGNRIADTKALTERFGTQKNVVLPQKMTTPIFRYAGATALDTMALVSDEFGRCDTVVVATMDGYWDALTASSLAGLHHCPIILTESSNLSWQASQAILKLGASKVFIAGGPAAVSDGVKKDIEKLEGVESVDRLAGDIAINTALKIYEEGKGSWGKTAVVATSATFQDALSVSPYAYANNAPIFLANASTTTLDPQVLSAIKEGGFERIIIVGGKAAVSDEVEKQLKGIECKRLDGPTAYETSGAIASWCVSEGMSAAYAGIATGSAYYDALAGSSLCGLNNSVLVLADDAYRTNVSGFIASNKASARQLNVFGGTAAVSEATYQAIEAALK